jgi:hypothetical protein
MASLMTSAHEALTGAEPALAVKPACDEHLADRATANPRGRRRPGLRLLLRTTLAADEYAIEEAGSARRAQSSPASGARRWWCSTSTFRAAAVSPSARS